VSVLDLFSAANAWASAAGAEHHTPTIGEVILPAINFAIYAAVIYYFALPAVRNLLRSRREEMVATIAQASAKRQQAEALVGEYRAKIARVEQEALSIQADVRDGAEREKTKILSEAETLAAKLRDDARFLADREVQVARETLRAEMASDAEALARDLVQRNISPADHGRLAQEFIQQIGKAQ
jgi:F-type H+-transporting ATPase subunit b